MCNKSKLGDECYMGNISNYTDRILETSTYLRFFLHYKEEDIVRNRKKESYVATKNNRERTRKWFHIHLANLLKTLQHTDIAIEYITSFVSHMVEGSIILNKCECLHLNGYGPSWGPLYSGEW